MNRMPNALIHSTAAEIAGHSLVDLFVGGTRRLGQQRRRRHDLAALAVSALRNLLGDPGLLHRMRVVDRQSFDRRNFLGAHRRDRGLEARTVLLEQREDTRPRQLSSLVAPRLPRLALQQSCPAA